MEIELTPMAHKSYKIAHDLNFAQERYESNHELVRIASSQNDSLGMNKSLF